VPLLHYRLLFYRCNTAKLSVQYKEVLVCTQRDMSVLAERDIQH